MWESWNPLLTLWLEIIVRRQWLGSKYIWIKTKAGPNATVLRRALVRAKWSWEYSVNMSSQGQAHFSFLSAKAGTFKSCGMVIEFLKTVPSCSCPFVQHCLEFCYKDCMALWFIKLLAVRHLTSMPAGFYAKLFWYIFYQLSDWTFVTPVCCACSISIYDFFASYNVVLKRGMNLLT